MSPVGRGGDTTHRVSPTKPPSSSPTGLPQSDAVDAGIVHNNAEWTKPKSNAIMARGESISLARRAAATARKRREEARAELERQGVREGMDSALEGIVGRSASTRANVSQNKVKRSKRVKWGIAEVQALQEGVHKYGEGRWAVILREYATRFNQCRISVDLKDKWRNLFKAHRGTAPTPSLSQPESPQVSRQLPHGIQHNDPARMVDMYVTAPVQHQSEPRFIPKESLVRPLAIPPGVTVVKTEAVLTVSGLVGGVGAGHLRTSEVMEGGGDAATLNGAVIIPSSTGNHEHGDARHQMQHEDYVRFRKGTLREASDNVNHVETALHTEQIEHTPHVEHSVPVHYEEEEQEEGHGVREHHIAFAVQEGGVEGEVLAHEEGVHAQVEHGLHDHEEQGEQTHLGPHDDQVVHEHQDVHGHQVELVGGVRHVQQMDVDGIHRQQHQGEHQGHDGGHIQRSHELHDNSEEDREHVALGHVQQEQYVEDLQQTEDGQALHRQQKAEYVQHSVRTENHLQHASSIEYEPDAEVQHQNEQHHHQQGVHDGGSQVEYEEEHEMRLSHENHAADDGQATHGPSGVHGDVVGHSVRMGQSDQVIKETVRQVEHVVHGEYTSVEHHQEDEEHLVGHEEHEGHHGEHQEHYSDGQQQTLQAETEEHEDHQGVGHDVEQEHDHGQVHVHISEAHDSVDEDIEHEGHGDESLVAQEGVVVQNAHSGVGAPISGEAEGDVMHESGDVNYGDVSEHAKAEVEVLDDVDDLRETEGEGNDGGGVGVTEEYERDERYEEFDPEQGHAGEHGDGVGGNERDREGLLGTSGLLHIGREDGEYVEDGHVEYEEHEREEDLGHGDVSHEQVGEVSIGEIEGGDDVDLKVGGRQDDGIEASERMVVEVVDSGDGVEHVDLRIREGRTVVEEGFASNRRNGDGEFDMMNGSVGVGYDAEIESYDGSGREEVEQRHVPGEDDCGEVATGDKRGIKRERDAIEIEMDGEEVEYESGRRRQRSRVVEEETEPECNKMEDVEIEQHG